MVDGNDQVVGKVHDVRLVQGGPPAGGIGAAFRVEGLIVGPSMVATRFGYGRTGMTRPLLLAAPLRVRRQVRFVPWERVGEIGASTVRISGSAADLGEPAPLQT